MQKSLGGKKIQRYGYFHFIDYIHIFHDECLPQNTMVNDILCN